MIITVTYTSLDGAYKRRTFKTLRGASNFAQERVGETPELGTFYAVSFDGLGRVTATGCAIADLFPAPQEVARG